MAGAKVFLILNMGLSYHKFNQVVMSIAAEVPDTVSLLEQPSGM